MPAILRHLLHRLGPAHRALSRHRGTRIHAAAAGAPAHIRLGSSYGGWTVIPALLDPDSVVYSVGVGSDISFDLALIARIGCEVHAFDPTPAARGWIAGQALPARFHFHPLGLAASDGDMAFEAPAISDHASFSAPGEGAAPERLVQCPVRRLASLMEGLGHSHIDLLKMDIEGFEYPVIADVLAGPLRPVQWMIEFHHTMYHFTAADTRAAVAALRDAGYLLYSVSNVGLEYGFVRRDALGNL